MLPKTIFILFLPLCFPTNVTFKDVRFIVHRKCPKTFTHTVKVIWSSNSLKDYLPRYPFDKIKFRSQYIPVLRENSLADLRLSKLAIEYCQVTEIQPGAFKNVPLLRRLSLKGNKLVEIEEGVFNNLNVSTLDLSSNSISNIASGALDDLPNISEIDLSRNKIGEWNPSWFRNTPHLTTIDMGYNSISTLPKDVFKNLQGHRTAGRRSEVTISIILSKNQIGGIAPGAFNGLERIDDLRLDDNRLEDFDENLLADVEVNSLDLETNKIRCLNGELGKVIKAHTTFLDSNPLDCDCLYKIKTWADKNGKRVRCSSSTIDCFEQNYSTRQ